MRREQLDNTKTLDEQENHGNVIKFKGQGSIFISV
jgi:hypothetical protein